MGRPLGRETVTRLRAAPVNDGHGNLELNWSDPDRLDIRGCQVDPGETDEVLEHRDARLTTWKVYAPAGTDITALDRAEYRGVTHLVDGRPDTWPDGGRLDYVKFILKEWRG